MSTWIGSPNYSQGRYSKIDRIVIHWMVGNLSSTDATFQDKKRQTSAHYGIENSTVHQYVKESDTAWHSGVSSMNARSIGIEHSAAPGRDATKETLETSAKLIADICSRNNISVDRVHIIKHYEVPFATQCSGTIPVEYLVERAKQIQEGEDMIKPTSEKEVVDWFMWVKGEPPRDRSEIEYYLQNDIRVLYGNLLGTSRPTVKEATDAAKEFDNKDPQFVNYWTNKPKWLMWKSIAGGVKENESKPSGNFVPLGKEVYVKESK